MKEDYEVVSKVNSGTVEIKLTHTIFEVETEARLLVDLALNEKSQVVVRFRRDEEESMDSLTFIRLTTYLREHLKA